MDKVFWFNYQDFNVEVALADKTAGHGWQRPNANLRAPTEIRPAYFGLYSARTRKPAFYAFLAYPERPGFIYLPLIVRPYSGPPE